MMYDQGKSDPPIVPGKPPNKAECVAAEAVEARGGAKGNAVLSSTHQTQSWASVSQAMDRIRCAARRDKRVRLTALLHHVNVDLLRFAFHQLPSELAIRPPQCRSTPSQRSLPVARTSLTKAVFISTAV